MIIVNLFRQIEWKGLNRVEMDWKFLKLTENIHDDRIGDRFEGEMDFLILGLPRVQKDQISL